MVRAPTGSDGGAQPLGRPYSGMVSSFEARGRHLYDRCARGGGGGLQALDMSRRAVQLPVVPVSGRREQSVLGVPSEGVAWDDLGYASMVRVLRVDFGE
eukprot:COSAG01_NODE_2466_length_7642_cov_5.268991_3_plen_99_part_00